MAPRRGNGRRRTGGQEDVRELRSRSDHRALLTGHVAPADGVLHSTSRREETDVGAGEREALRTSTHFAARRSLTSEPAGSNRARVRHSCARADELMRTSTHFAARRSVSPAPASSRPPRRSLKSEPASSSRARARHWCTRARARRHTSQRRFRTSRRGYPPSSFSDLKYGATRPLLYGFNPMQVSSPILLSMIGAYLMPSASRRCVRAKRPGRSSTP